MRAGFTCTVGVAEPPAAVVGDTADDSAGVVVTAVGTVVRWDLLGVVESRGKGRLLWLQREIWREVQKVFFAAAGTRIRPYLSRLDHLYRPSIFPLLTRSLRKD